MVDRPKVGDRAPDFTLPDEAGNRVSLYEELDSGPVMLVFYPGDFTPVCTRQLCSYGDRYQEFRDLGIRIFAISDDPVDRHREFRRQKQLPFPLLSDVDQEVIDQFGGSGWLSGGGAHRANFLIDEEGTIGYAHVEKLSVFHRGADELLEAARNLVEATKTN